ncbi:hypothetical protein DSOL_4149 [Desulfosporosinus metallidurans]|uniref:Uncharacterized protein n=1 Tax=Desulfosporosinus metallidurans TaxID=1888891 RepID=A0A1Q8QLP4_9FIRM|nr:hypothetical protein DSOL_4149 [Desulfosporosinus metallidurans]
MNIPESIKAVDKCQVLVIIPFDNKRTIVYYRFIINFI